MKKGYTTHRTIKCEIEFDLGELGQVIKELPADSKSREKLDILRRQILADLQNNIAYEIN